MRASPWWHEAVGYSVYLRSFADTTGNGVGDLAGVTAHLDHLHELGVNLLWISPFYPSPLADFGYDVTDYTAVDPEYGDLSAFDELLRHAHSRGMRLLVDLVPNHTSVEHEWFRRAVSDPAGPYRDYYVWGDPSPGGGAPNNWVSYFGGPAWTLDTTSGEYYLHLFLAQQPDLNWRNPAVHDEFLRILRFWLERGVDGFRVDAAQGLVKDHGLRSNPQVMPMEAGMDRLEQWQAFDHVHDIAQPETHQIFASWRALCSEYDAALVGETSVSSVEALGALLPGTGLNIGMWLAPARLGWHPHDLRDALIGPLRLLADPHAIGWVVSTLDEKRPATRFGGGDIGRRRALALSTLLFFLPGVPFLYQGEELGLVDGVVPPGRRADPVSDHQNHSRDGCRTPMPWRPSPSFGFSSTTDTWLPDGGRTVEDTAEYQRGRPGSWFERYRALVGLRLAIPELRRAGVEALDVGIDQILAFRRDDLVAVANLGEGPVTIGLAGEVLYNTDDVLDSTAEGLRLRAAQALVLRQGPT